MLDGTEGMGGLVLNVGLGYHILDGRNVAEGGFELALVEIEEGDERVGRPGLLGEGHLPQEGVKVVGEDVLARFD